MKIRITTLPPHGLPVDFTIEPEVLNTRLSEGKSIDISFVAALTINARATPIVGAVTFKGEVKAKITQDCASCGKTVERALVVPIEWMLKPKLGQQEENDDIGIFYYEGDHFDLDEGVAEACLLQLTPYWRCTECESSPFRAFSSKPAIAVVSTPKTNSLAAALEKARLRSK